MTKHLLLISNNQALIEIFQKLEGFELSVSPHTWYVAPSQNTFEVVIVDADFARMTENLNRVIANATVAFAIVSPQNLVAFSREHRRKFYDFWPTPLYPELLYERILKALEHAALFEPFSHAVYFIWQERVKNPFAAIKGYTDVLLSGITGKLTEQQIQFLERIKSDSEQIYSNIMSYSREEELKVGYIPWAATATVDVNEGLLEIQKFLEHDCTLELFTPTNIPRIETDRRIFYNLSQALSRIIQRSTPEKRKISVSVAVISPKELAFTIALPFLNYLHPIARQKISDFLPQLRSDMLSNSESSSISVALIFIEHYLFQVGSDAFFESELGKGSTFYFTLPIAKDEP